ncbi:MAG: MBL fold metallo-hydrolase [Firmicutes bacterium]|nr:MBL fold metallo-hydrolase [Bacillota bacterium]MDD4263793.1 MBL fold metallo-hydrolase [Bacillota bacterium]MDD4693212.1 MBL fold metallo-hydrolase [Bacillota bacterium]
MGKLEFLGTGTSTGVPLIGCQCKVCLSKNPKNNRMRASSKITVKDTVILIDTGPEFRLQAIRSNISRVDGVLITHTHADHVAGFDDLRAFNFITGEPVKVWGNPSSCEILKSNYPYIFGSALQVGGGLPQIELSAAEDLFYVGNIKVEPIPVWHGRVPVNGYRIGSMAYVTDVSNIPQRSMAKLEGLDVLVLGALRYRKHSTHLNIDEALEIVDKLRPKRTFFTHIGHDLEHERVSERLKALSSRSVQVDLAYDGLILEFPD